MNSALKNRAKKRAFDSEDSFGAIFLLRVELFLGHRDHASKRLFIVHSHVS